MKADKTAQDTDLSSIPGEFRENYRFLSELINCKHKNNSAAQSLETVLEPRLCHIRGKLNPQADQNPEPLRERPGK